MEYTEEDLGETQKALNLYPDASPFWDTSDGQWMLDCASVHNLSSQNTNRERCRIHAELMESSLQEAGL